MRRSLNNTGEARRPWSVSETTSYIKGILSTDDYLKNIMVEGEVTDFKRAYSGHCYFKLKDNNALLTCVMFRSRAARVSFDVSDGMKLTAKGAITVYEKGGNYQLLVESLKQSGLGDLYLQFLELKEKLSKKGYFDTERKRELPYIPKGIGIATSAKGAGLQDMIKTIQRRFPPANIYISPTTVQGKQAPASIVNSINLLNSHEKVNVIIVGRGGGSFEDLNCFNDESVADAVYHSKKPIISGVGHETDFTICDMVADFRAETPTAAAAKAVPDLEDLEYTLENMGGRLKRGLGNIVEKQRIVLDSLSPAKLYRPLENRINGYRQMLDDSHEKLLRNTKQNLNDNRREITLCREKLKALNPFKVLERGYAIVKDGQGRYSGRAADLKTGDEVKIIFHDGTADAEIKEVNIQEEEAANE